LTIGVASTQPSHVQQRIVTPDELVRKFSALSGVVRGDGGLPLSGVAPLGTARADQISFLSNPKYSAQVTQTKAGVVILSEQAYGVLPDKLDKTFITCAKPYVFFALAAQYFAYENAPAHFVHPSACISASASVAEGVHFGPNVVVGERCRIGSGVRLLANITLGDDCVIGEGTRIYPGVHIYRGCKIGARGIVHSGAVIGADGFGFANDDGQWVKIPQTGAVAIGDDCEVGANTTIDRGAMSDTVIGDGVKIDNQVQIGHNVEVGDHTAIAGCVGIAGSTRIGRGVQLGGAAMILGHLSIADGVIVSAASTVTRDITTAGFYTGIFPIDENARWERTAAIVRNLDKMRDRIRRLEALLNQRDGTEK
jgi:UDP-3-O-[3-hydroxymyristoyl] glucosamine N-acyltransferase